MWVPRMDGSSGQGFLPYSLLHRIIWSPTSKNPPPSPPTCCLISCEVKEVVYHQASDMCSSGTHVSWAQSL